MLWRVRTTLPDRPGALAALTQRCGEAGVNILGLQIFPGIDRVTDEMVLRAPADWGEPEVTNLLRMSGGLAVVVQPCTEAALADQPTRHVQAARTILERPMAFPEVVARLFDAEPEPSDPAVVHDVMEMTVGDIGVQVHRRTPFTETEHARGAAMAALVSEVLQRGRESTAIGTRPPAQPPRDGRTPTYVVGDATVTALHDGVAVGFAELLPPTGEPVQTRPVNVRVEPAWQRRGIGTRLLVDAARLAHGLGAAEIVLTTRSDNQAILPMVLAAGLRGRIRMAAEVLTVRIPVRDLRPLLS